MKRYDIFVIILFFFFCSLITGCINNSTDNHGDDEDGHDSRLIGEWRNQESLEILEFRADGMYTITEAEMANWSTEPDGKLWMYGSLYSYTLSDNNTVLNIVGQGYSWTFKKISVI